MRHRTTKPYFYTQRATYIKCYICLSGTQWVKEDCSKSVRGYILMICTSRKPYSWNFLSLMLLSQQAFRDCNWSFKNHHSSLKPARALKTARCYWSGIKRTTSPGTQIPGSRTQVCYCSPFPVLLSAAHGPRALGDGGSTSWSRSNTSNKTKAGSCLFHEAGSLPAKCKHKPWTLHKLGEKRKQSKKQFTGCRCLLMPFKMF